MGKSDAEFYVCLFLPFMTNDMYVFWGFWNILCPSGSSSSIFINIALSIANVLLAMLIAMLI